MVRKYILFIILIFSVGIVRAQYVDRGQDPAGIRWKQINTENFQLIYPSNCEKNAQYYANILDILYKGKRSSLGHVPRKVSVIMHTHGGVSNGTVYWAPSSLELFTTPPQEGDFQVWAEHLVCHEFRHVVQIDKLNQGMTKFLTYIFGQQATAAVLGAYVPMWFLEGDAVAFETGMTRGGRGRLPKFEQELRAQLVEKGIYSYDKAVLGSYKDFIPDRYTLGYYMIANSRKNYGTGIWESALSRVGRNPLGVTSFSSGIKKIMQNKRELVWDTLGRKLALFDSKFLNVDSVLRANAKRDAKVMLYNDNMTELQTEWKYKDRQKKMMDCNDFTPRKKVYTSYRYPHYTEKGGIIALKSGLADPVTIVEILPKRKERKIFEPGYGVCNIDYKDGKIVWSEYNSNFRWGNGGRHIVVLYDIKKKSCKRFKYKYNLFAPCLSDDGRIVAVGDRTDNSVFLAIIENGRVNEIIDAKFNEQFQSPCWISENEVAVVVLDNNGKHLEIIDVISGIRKVITAPMLYEITGLKCFKSKLLFNASLSGKDEIYSYDLNSKKMSVITDSRFGSTDVDMNEYNKILFSTYSADGYCVVEGDYIEKSVSGKYEFNLAEILREQEKGIKPFQAPKDKVFESREYRKLSHLFNFHSWAPVFIDGLEQDSDIGFSVASQNMLSTMFLVAGYKDDEAYSNGVGYLNLSYRGWWPIINFKTKYGNVNSSFADFNAKLLTSSGTDTIVFAGKRRRLDIETELQFPIDISKGRFSRKIIPMVEFDFVTFSDINIDLFARFEEKGGGFIPADRNDYVFMNDAMTANFLSYRLFAYNLKKTAVRDIDYRFGQIVEGGYRHSINGDFDYGYTYYGEGRFYFPGLAKHHSIELYGGYQYFDIFNEGSGAPFSKDINSPRGVNLYGKRVKSLRSTYNMPLLYPDFNFGSLAYVKRVSSGVFYDYGTEERFINSSLEESGYYSFGGEFKADVNFLRLVAPVNVGVRVGYESRTKNVFTDLLLRLSLDF